MAGHKIEDFGHVNTNPLLLEEGGEEKDGEWEEEGIMILLSFVSTEQSQESKIIIMFCLNRNKYTWLFLSLMKAIIDRRL